MTLNFLSTPYDDGADHSGCEVEDVDGADAAASH